MGNARKAVCGKGRGSLTAKGVRAGRGASQWRVHEQRVKQKEQEKAESGGGGKGRREAAFGRCARLGSNSEHLKSGCTDIQRGSEREEKRHRQCQLAPLLAKVSRVFLVHCLSLTALYRSVCLLPPTAGSCNAVRSTSGLSHLLPTSPPSSASTLSHNSSKPGWRTVRSGYREMRECRTRSS